MSAEPSEVVEEPIDDRSKYSGVLRFYNLAKHQEWMVRDVPWGEIPPIPEGKGSPQRQARRRDVWRSVVMQQPGRRACLRDSRPAERRPDPERGSTAPPGAGRGAPYRGVAEAHRQIGGEGERDPHLDRLGHMFLEADTLEEKVFLMQVFFERLIIPRFRLIARSSRGTVLEDLCNRLAVDDGIHHGAGMAYERVLLETADATIKSQLVEGANRMLPEFAAHALWRPKAREMIGHLMEARDRERLKTELNHGVRLAQSLGLDVSDVVLPF
jgi:hypothetical protein